MRTTPRRAGFTLVEMMVVVAIIGVLVVLSYSLLTGQPRALDVAEVISRKISEASRKAASGGTVRANVAQSIGLTARTRVIVELGSPTVVSTERLVEDQPATATGASWQELNRMVLPKNVQVLGWRSAPTLSSTVGVELTTDPTIYCEPDGRCTGMIIYLKTADNRTRARVIVLPLGGTPITFDGW